MEAVNNVPLFFALVTGTNGSAISQTSSPFGSGVGNLSTQYGTSGLYSAGANAAGSILSNAGLSLGNIGTPTLAGAGGGGTGSALYGGAGLSGLLSSSTPVGAANIGGHLSAANPWTSGGSSFGTGGLGSALDGGASANAYRGGSGSALLGSTSGSYERMRDYDRSVSPTGHGSIRHARSIIIRNVSNTFDYSRLGAGERIATNVVWSLSGTGATFLASLTFWQSLTRFISFLATIGLQLADPTRSPTRWVRRR